MKEKLFEMSVGKRITIIFISILVIVALIVSAVYFLNNKEDELETTSGELSNYSEVNVPDVNEENTKIEVSETELTSNNITVNVSSKLEDYNLYYYIDTIKELEDEEQNEQKDNKEADQKENEISEEDNQEVDKEKNEISEEDKQKITDENYVLYKDSIEIEANSKIYFKYELDGKYSENQYTLEINNINKEEEAKEELENEKATEEELKKEKVTSKDSSAKYYVIVNYSSNVVTVYGKDANNNYTVPVKAMVCSTGVSTPRSGVYKLTTTRYRWRALFGGVYGQYAVKIVGNILFHSVPYLSPDNSKLEYWEYDKLGTAASAGCIRLKVIDAMWIYNNCGSGTQVEFTANSANPLGKPSAQKISGYPDLRGFDPTDPASNNPWKNANIPAPQPTTNNKVEKPNNTQGTNQGNSSNNNSNANNNNSNTNAVNKNPETTDKKENNTSSNNTNKVNNINTNTANTNKGNTNSSNNSNTTVNDKTNTNVVNKKSDKTTSENE